MDGKYLLVHVGDWADYLLTVDNPDLWIEQDCDIAEDACYDDADPGPLRMGELQADRRQREVSLLSGGQDHHLAGGGAPGTPGVRRGALMRGPFIVDRHGLHHEATLTHPTVPGACGFAGGELAKGLGKTTSGSKLRPRRPQAGGWTQEEPPPTAAAGGRLVFLSSSRVRLKLSQSPWIETPVRARTVAKVLHASAT